MSEDTQITLFTASAVLQLLNEIEELSDSYFKMVETDDGYVEFTINETTYTIDPNQADEVETDEETLLEIEESSDDGYEALSDSGYEFLEDTISDDSISNVETENEVIEGGIIKNAVKSLMLGGMIRFAAKHLVK